MELDIDQDETFQRREWRMERLGWSLVGLFVLAGAVGLLGAGPLSRASAGDGDVRVDYDRVVHYEADDAVTLTFGPGAVEDGTITATIRGSWPGAIDLQGISPEPSEQRMVPGGVTLEFLVEETGDLEVSMSFRAQALGTHDAELSVGADTVGFSQLTLP